MIVLRHRPLDLKLRHPFRIARGAADARRNVLVEIEEDGHLGRGEAAPIRRYREDPESATAALEVMAGRLGDRISLGFVVETERQVEQHLDSHLSRLPVQDTRSRAIVEQMKQDEARHALDAEKAGATRLPLPARLAMRAAAKVMTTTAHWV